MYTFQKIETGRINWDAIESCPDHHVFKSRQWMEFLVETQKVAPFILEVFDSKDRLCGYFIGERFKKVFTIIASPFEGWATPFQGLSLLEPVPVKKRLDIYHDLIHFLFTHNYCSLFQVSDMEVDLPHVAVSDYRFDYEIVKGYMLDLSPDQEVLYKNMSQSSARAAISRSVREGIAIREVTHQTEQYTELYYHQLCDVFSKQGLVPTHDIKFISAIFKNLLPARKVLLLEAVTLQQKKVASGFFVYDGGRAFFVGGASFREYQRLNPNEPLMWEAIVRLKQVGNVLLEFGGPRSYKEKYGPAPYAKPKIVAVRHSYIKILKNTAKRSYYYFREIKARLKGKR